MTSSASRRSADVCAARELEPVDARAIAEEDPAAKALEHARIWTGGTAVSAETTALGMTKRHTGRPGVPFAY